MQRKKRALGYILAGVLAVSAIAGCTPNSGSNAPAPASSTESTTASSGSGDAGSEAPEAQGGDANFRFLWWGGDARHNATIEAIELYQNSNPGVSIDAEYQGFDSYYQKLTTQLAGGTVADLFQVDQPWLPALVRQDSGIFADLNTLTDYIDLGEYDDDFMNDYVVYDGIVTGVPTGVNGHVYIYNTWLAEEIGLDTSYHWTWDDLLENGQKVAAYDPDAKLLNCNWTTLEYAVRQYVGQLTGEVYIMDDYTLSFTEEQLTEAYEMIVKMIDNNVVEPLAEVAVYAADMATHPKWANEKFVGMLNWPSTVSQYQSMLPDDHLMGAIPIAVMEGAKQTGIICRPSQVFSIYGGSNQKEAVAKFLNEIVTDEEYVVALGDSRGVPAAATASAILEEKGLLAPAVVEGTRIALETSGKPENGLTTDSEISSITQEMTQQVGYGMMTPQEAAAETIRRYEIRIEEIKAEEAA